MLMAVPAEGSRARASKLVAGSHAVTIGATGSSNGGICSWVAAEVFIGEGSAEALDRTRLACEDVLGRKSHDSTGQSGKAKNESHRGDFCCLCVVNER